MPPCMSLQGNLTDLPKRDPPPEAQSKSVKTYLLAAIIKNHTIVIVDDTYPDEFGGSTTSAQPIRLYGAVEPDGALGSRARHPRVREPS